MKRALVAALAVAAVSVAACGGDDKSSGSASSGGTSGDKKTIVYVPGLTGNPFYSTVACGAKSVAAKNNVDFSVQGAPEFDVAKQTAVVNALVAGRETVGHEGRRVRNTRARLAPLCVPPAVERGPHLRTCPVQEHSLIGLGDVQCVTHVG